MYMGLSRLVQLSLAAQDIEKDEFYRNGVVRVIAIRNAVYEAIRELREKRSSCETSARTRLSADQLGTFLVD